MGVLLLGAVLASSSSAIASALTKGDAAVEARVAISEYADHRCDLRLHCAYATYPDLTKYDCKRVSARAVRCDGSVQLVDSRDEPGRPLDSFCGATALVRVGRNVRISDWSCADDF